MTAECKSLTVEHVSVGRLKSAGNIRPLVSPAKRAALRQSIRENGIRVPLLGYRVAGEEFFYDGHHRLDEAKSLGLESVPVIFADHVPTQTEILIFQLVANCQRFDLKPMERARAIERLLHESGWPAAQVSAQLGMGSEATISRLLTLLVYSKDVQDLIDAGRIPISSAAAIAAVKDGDERARLIAGVLDGSLTRDKLVKRIQSGKNCNGSSRPRRSRPRPARFELSLGERRFITFTGSDLTLNLLIPWLEQFLTRVRQLESQKLEFADAMKALAANNA